MSDSIPTLSAEIDRIMSVVNDLSTLFLRISQFFENSLESSRWHTDLLDKMTLHITGIRERVVPMVKKDLGRFRTFLGVLA